MSAPHFQCILDRRDNFWREIWIFIDSLPARFPPFLPGMPHGVCKCQRFNWKVLGGKANPNWQPWKLVHCSRGATRDLQWHSIHARRLQLYKKNRIVLHRSCPCKKLSPSNGTCTARCDRERERGRLWQLSAVCAVPAHKQTPDLRSEKQLTHFLFPWFLHMCMAMRTPFCAWTLSVWHCLKQYGALWEYGSKYCWLLLL
jgi:hypothetical protein